jgi:hypothetical protein
LPKNFAPPPGWQPDPAWGPPPEGWPLWVTSEKKSHLLRNIVLGVVALSLCGIAGCIAVVVSGINKSVDESNKSEASAAASCQGKSYPDQQTNHDVCADAQGTVDVSGVSITATPLKRAGSGNLCSQVNYVNHSGKTQSFNLFDWKIQSPQGEVQNSGFDGGGNLGSGDIVNGGTKSGTMCYQGMSGTGQFVTIYKPPSFSSQRGIWLTNL